MATATDVKSLSWLQAELACITSGLTASEIERVIAYVKRLMAERIN